MFEQLEQRRMLSGNGAFFADGTCVPVGQAIKAGLQAGQSDRTVITVSTAAKAVAPIVALSANEKVDLIKIARDEKLARDVYNALYQKWGSIVFKNIAASEQQHFSTISKLLTKYSIANPVASMPAGKFDDAAVQQLYVQLVAKGKTSLQAAMQVGVTIEKLDIADLQTCIAQTTHTDICMVYTNLMNGSQNHLRAFESQLTRLMTLV